MLEIEEIGRKTVSADMILIDLYRQRTENVSRIPRPGYDKQCFRSLEQILALNARTTGVFLGTPTRLTRSLLNLVHGVFSSVLRNFLGVKTI